jgi:hypothetical protein
MGGGDPKAVKEKVRAKRKGMTRALHRAASGQQAIALMMLHADFLTMSLQEAAQSHLE